MNFKYNKDSLKESLTIEQVFELVNELGGEPRMSSGLFAAKTICHCGASHKLYYYDNTKLFHCYTGCGDASFDIYDLIVRINNSAGNKGYQLSRAIAFVAKYFGYTADTFEFEDNFEATEDWKIINNFKRDKDLTVFSSQRVEMKIYDDSILKHLPHPHIIPWEQEGISFDVMQLRGICYDPLNEAVVIPHYNINGELVGIRERTLIKENEIYGKYRPAVLNGQMYNHPLSFNVYNLNNSKENIKKFQKAIIFESEKSCLKYASYFGVENDITGAVCGSNLLNYQFLLLYNLGIKELIIAFDRQYREIGDEEYQIWVNKLKKISQKYRNFCNISFIFDTKNLLDYKNAPIDKGKEIFLQLFQERLDADGK